MYKLILFPGKLVELNKRYSASLVPLGGDDEEVTILQKQRYFGKYVSAGKEITGTLSDKLDDTEDIRSKGVHIGAAGFVGFTNIEENLYKGKPVKLNR